MRAGVQGSAAARAAAAEAAPERHHHHDDASPGGHDRRCACLPVTSASYEAPAHDSWRRAGWSCCAQATDRSRDVDADADTALLQHRRCLLVIRVSRVVLLYAQGMVSWC